jgi:hypothetical protein
MDGSDDLVRIGGPDERLIPNLLDADSAGIPEAANM